MSSSDTSAIAFCFEKGWIKPGDNVRVLGSGDKQMTVEQLPKLLELAVKLASMGARVRIELHPQGFLSVDVDRNGPDRLELSPELVQYLPEIVRKLPQRKEKQQRRPKSKGFGA